MIAIITEANDKVATGHLAEAKTLASTLNKCGQDVLLLVNHDVQPELLTGLEFPYEFYNDIYDCVDKTKIAMVIVTDLRDVSNDFVIAIKTANKIVICIDEFGNKRLDANMVINNLIDPAYHKYQLKEYAKFYGGPDYMIMKPDFAVFAKKERAISKEVKRIAICMGGADTPNATLKILKSLDAFAGNLDVIVGGGYSCKDELKAFIENKPNINLYTNIPNVYDVLYNADLAFSSGGNVLYELACLGTPALTVYTNPHEKSNAECMERKGFGFLIGQVNAVSSGDIKNAVYLLSDVNTRENHHTNGKKLVDGSAVERIKVLILTFITTRRIAKDIAATHGGASSENAAT